MLNVFGVADYVVFGLTLAISAGIGIYFSCSGGKQKTTKEFLQADGKMSIIPVAISLTVSFISANSIVGYPSEIYTYGTMFAYFCISQLIALILAAYFFLPVFYNLNTVSVFEYAERRFGRVLRLCNSVTSIINVLFYMGVVLYLPSLSLSAITNINIWLCVAVLGGVTTLYTTVGGMKAVLWTDTFQAVIMVVGMLCVVIKGAMEQGTSAVYEDALEGGRMNIFDSEKVFDPNPLTRHSLWTFVFGGTATYLMVYTSQTTYQRAKCLPSLKAAQRSFMWNLPGLYFTMIMSCVAGLLIYSNYKDCDPRANGDIKSNDQLYPLYMMHTLGMYSGLPGLVVASVFSGSISTISSGLNSVAALILEDIVKTMIKPDITDEKATLLSKILSASFGVLAIGMSFVFSTSALVIQMSLTFAGMFGGPSLGVVIAGLFMPWVNNIGAIVGFIVSLGFSGWIGFGSIFHAKYQMKLPTSVDGCLAANSSFLTGNTTMYDNVTTEVTTSTLMSTTTQNIDELMAESRSGVGVLYNISYQYMATIGVIIFSLVATIVSIATGMNKKSKVSHRLVNPLVCKVGSYLPKSISCDLIDYSNDESMSGEQLKMDGI